MLKISRSVIDFFLQIDFASENIDPLYHYIPIEDYTNEYKAYYFLRCPNSIKSKIDGIFEEISEILRSCGHHSSDQIILDLSPVFLLSVKADRSEKVVVHFFSLMSKINLKQYLF